MIVGNEGAGVVEASGEGVAYLRVGDRVVNATGGIGSYAEVRPSIGTVSTDAKADLARAHDCDHPIVYTRENLVARVHDITGGSGVSVVYDSVGKNTFFQSLDCLRPMGLLACFGRVSSRVPPFALTELASRKGLFVTRPRSTGMLIRASICSTSHPRCWTSSRVGS